jgi:trigger factor
MQAAIEEINSVQRRIVVKLTKEQVNSAFEGQFNALKKKVRLKGFRPGKAPMSMIKKFYGDSARPEVFEKLVKTNLFDAIQQNDLRPVAAPVVETEQLPQEGEEYTFSAVVDVMPEIGEIQYEGLSATVRVLKADDAAVEKEIQGLQRSKGMLKTVEDNAVAAKGHVLIISQSASESGEELSQFKIEDMHVEIGGEQLLPDLENALIGMKASDKKEVKVKLPQDYDDKEFAGKELTFNLEVKGIKELSLPAVDDELAKDMGFESLEKVRGFISSQISKNAEDHKRNQYETQLLDQLVEKHPFEVPPSFVDQIIDSMIGEMKFDNKEEQKKATQDEQMRDRYREAAKRRAQNSMILAEIARKNEIKVEDQDLDNHIRKQFSQYGEPMAEERLQEFRKMMGDRFNETILLAKAMNLIIASADIKEVDAEA